MKLTKDELDRAEIIVNQIAEDYTYVVDNMKELKLKTRYDVYELTARRVNLKLGTNISWQTVYDMSQYDKKDRGNKVHPLEYESKGWKRLDNDPCKPKTRIRLARIKDLTSAYSIVEWETEGWLNSFGKFSLEKKENLSFDNSEPTHWKAI